jgi:hypothetical protein
MAKETGETGFREKRGRILATLPKTNEEIKKFQIVSFA